MTVTEAAPIKQTSRRRNETATPVDKVLAYDLLAHPFRFDEEKVEGMALGGGGLWVSSDNDGGEALNFVVRLDPAVLGVAGGAAGPVADVVINEVTSSGADLVEIKNRGGDVADLSGWKITDSDPLNVFVLPPGTTIAPGGYLWIEGAMSPAPLHLPFDLGSADSAILYTPYDVLVDQHTWSAHVASASRCPDGTGAFVSPTPPTPGAANTCP